jgi:hypothetical protein
MEKLKLPEKVNNEELQRIEEERALHTISCEEKLIGLVLF